MIAGADTEGREPMRDLVGPGVEFAEGEMLLADDERKPIRHAVDDVLEEVGEVEGHLDENRTRFSFEAPLPTARLSA